MRFTQLLDKFLEGLEFAKGGNTLIFVIMDGSPHCIEREIEAKGLKIHKIDESSEERYLSKLEIFKKEWMFTDENVICLLHGLNQGNKFKIIKYLNAQRDSLAEIKRPIVILGNEEEIRGIAEIAPDLWRFRSRTYDLREELRYEVPLFIKEMIESEDKIKRKIEENKFLLGEIRDEFHLSELYKNLSILYLMLDEEEKSKEFFDKLRLSDEEISEIYKIKGDIYLLKGKIDEAINYYEFSLDFFKNNIEAINNLGVAYDKIKEYGKVEEQFNRLIELCTSYPYSYYNRGLVNFKLGECEKAIMDFENAIPIVKRELEKEEREREVELRGNAINLEIPRGKAINPEIFAYLNLREVYALFGVKDYFKVKKKLKDSSMKAYAIFGFWDILVKHYENVGDFDIGYLKLRLPCSDDKVLNFGAMSIGRVIKFRGKERYEEYKGSLRLKDKYKIHRPAHEIEVRGKIATLLSKKKIQRDYIDKLTKQKILIDVDEGLEYSDIMDDEKKKMSFEAIVLLRVSSIPPSVIVNNIQYFNMNVLKSLMEIKEIRTIEQILSGEGYVSGYNYILHVVVKSLEQLREIVVEKIHRSSKEKGIIVSTNVILPAETISEGKYEVLYETVIFDYAMQKDLEEILDLLKSEFFEPFLIKKLDEEDIEEIIKFYVTMKRGVYQKNLATPFIYGIASALLKIEKGGNVAEEIYEKCMHLFLRIFSDFEKDIAENFGEWLDRVSKKIKDEKEGLKILIHTLYKYKKRDLKIEDLEKMTVGQRVQIIQMWNSDFYNAENMNKFKMFVEKKLENDEKKKILNLIEEIRGLKPEERTIMFDKKDLFKEFQSNNGPEIRNWFAHFGSYMGDFKLKGKEDVRKILKVAKICLDFIS